MNAEQCLIETVCPPHAVVVCGPGDGAAPHLFPEEEAAVAGALDRRRREFGIGRAYARDALRRLGAEAGAIPSRPDRAPVWPNGVAGSLTHTGGLIAVVVAWQGDVAGIGLDVEARERPLSRRLDRFIRTQGERDAMAACTFPEELDPLRLVFSAKESVHKCVAPRSGITLGFQDVELDFDLRAGTFQPRLALPKHAGLPDFAELIGRFAVTSRFVITTVVLPAVAPVSGVSECVPATHPLEKRQSMSQCRRTGS